MDTLAYWMAHYIAELIQAVEVAGEEERPSRMSEAAGAILRLWKHRREFPHGRRPFEESERICAALESLDLNERSFRYFDSSVMETAEADLGAEADKWLRSVKGIDYSAKLLIRYCLAQAARGALDKSREWVTLAEAAGAKAGTEDLVVRFLSDESDLLDESDPGDSARKEIQDRLERLEAFGQMAASLAGELRARLQNTPASHSPEA